MNSLGFYPNFFFLGSVIIQLFVLYIGYLFFTKDNAHELSSIKGYYAEIKMVNNNNKSRSELFQISLAADESSK